MPEEYTTPSRLHSARRNKRWQVITWCGASLILLIWISSEIAYCRMLFGIGRISIGAASLQSVCAAGYENYPLSKPEFDVQFAPDSQFNNQFNRIIPELILDDGTALVIPYWMILAAFLTTQYFLLPKSLPVTEESERTDA